MSAKHTPGPWFVRKGGSAWGNFSIDGDVFFIAETIGGLDKEEKANAHLIAAAPDLLEALRALVDDIGERFNISSQSTNPGMRDAVNQARAAIAKAEGCQA